MALLMALLRLSLLLLWVGEAWTEQEGVVRLYRNGIPDTNQSWSSGIVQIFYNGQWGNICDDSSFGSDEADVICHQLGYTGAFSYSNTGDTTIWGSDSSVTNIDDVSCSTCSYLTITQCSFSTSISSSCTDTNDVIVTCHSARTWTTPSPGNIRLTGGTYSNQGLVEVYCNGQWGAICHRHISGIPDGKMCKQLGYNGVDSIAVGYAYDEVFNSSSWWTTDCQISSDTCLVNSCNSCRKSSNTCQYNGIILICRYFSSDPKLANITVNSCKNSTDGNGTACSTDSTGTDSAIGNDSPPTVIIIAVVLTASVAVAIAIVVVILVYVVYLVKVKQSTPTHSATPASEAQKLDTSGRPHQQEAGVNSSNGDKLALFADKNNTIN